ncbi:MAG: FAD-dependent oxidoreductase [Nitrosopumilus sp.]
MTGNQTILIIGGSFGGIKTAWDLRNKLPRKHNIILMSDKPKTTFRASFPRVVFEDLPLEELVLDLKSNFNDSGIEFKTDRLVSIDQPNDEVVGSTGRYQFDYLVLATGARHAYELIPGSYEHAHSICDPSRIMETKAAVQEFRKGDVYAGVTAGYTPCDGPPLEMILSMDHRLRKLNHRSKTNLNFITDKANLMPPGGPKTWAYLKELFKKRQITAHLDVSLERLDGKYLYFEEGSRKHYDLCLLVPPYRGIKELEKSGLTDEKGFIPVLQTTMRSQKCENDNIYAVGDAAALPGPKQGHITLMQAGVAAAHIAWRINGKGDVPSYLPEFKCVAYSGGKNGIYMYADWLSDGDTVEIKSGTKPYLSKIEFEQLFFSKKGNIGELHRKMMK